MFTYTIPDTLRHVNYTTYNNFQIPVDIELSYGKINVKIGDIERDIYSVIQKGECLNFSLDILHKIFDRNVSKSFAITVFTEQLKPIEEINDVDEVTFYPVWNVSIDDFNFSNSMIEFFSTNRYISPNDCYKIPISYYDSSMLLQSNNARNVFLDHFFVTVASISTSKTEDCNIYTFDYRKSKMIIQKTNVVHKRIFDFDCHSTDYSDVLHSLIEVTTNILRSYDVACSLAVGYPMVHVCGPKLSGKGSLISSVAHTLGHQYLSLRGTDVIGQTSSAMEKKFEKITSLTRNGHFLSIHFEDFDGFFLSGDTTVGGRYDQRTIRVFTKILESISKIEGREILLFLSTENELPMEIDRCVVVRHDIGLLSDRDRTNLILRYFNDDQSVQDLIHLSTRTSKIELLSILRTIVDANLDSRKAITDKFKSIVSSGSDKDMISIDSVSWRDIGGLGEVIEEVCATIRLILSQHRPVQGYKVRKSGILLFGDPGTGKTLLAKAVASECHLNFVSVKGPELLNMYVGQTEENVRSLFLKIRRMIPCLLFCDELDSVVPRRGFSGDSGGVMDRVVSQFALEMDAINNEEDMRVLVMGATNRPDLIDPALLRNGRFDKLFHMVGGLHKKDQLEILRSQTYKLHLGPDVDLDAVVAAFPDQPMTGAFIYGLVSAAVMNAIRRTVQMIEELTTHDDCDLTVLMEDFVRAMDWEI